MGKNSFYGHRSPILNALSSNKKVGKGLSAQPRNVVFSLSRDRGNAGSSGICKTLEVLLKVKKRKKIVKFFSYTLLPVLPHLHWNCSHKCEKYCFSHNVAGCAMHLCHLLTPDPSFFLFSFCHSPLLFYLSFLSVPCSGTSFQKGPSYYRY